MAWKIGFFVVLSLLQCYETRNINTGSQKLKLVIDQDGGADDAMAVVMCLLFEKYFNGMEVVALTTTHGNVNESQVFKNSQRFLDLVNRRDVPIYRGATKALVTSIESDFFFGFDGLGDNGDVTIEPIAAEKQHAAIGLIELSKKYKGELVVMAIGPQTNIALAQRLDPGFIGRLAQLYVGAGDIYNEQRPKPEFNAEMDVEAYQIVAENAKTDKVTLIPFSQIKASLNLTREWRENVLGAIDTRVMKALNSFQRKSIVTSDSWNLLDPAVAAIVLEERLVEEFKLSNNSIILCGSQRGINTNTFGSEDNNVRLVYSFNQKYYEKLLLDIFSAELKVCSVKHKLTSSN